MKKILFVFATHLEAQSFELTEHFFFTGMGPEKVYQTLTASVLQGYDEIWNIGFAGALKRALSFGSIHHISHIGKHPDNIALSLYPEGKKLISFDRPLHDPILRDQLSSDWDLVDMEGHAVAEIARTHQMPCHVIKIVSDNADANTSASILENAPYLSMLLKKHLS